MINSIRRERDPVRGIVETVPIGIAVVTADGDLSFANEQAKTIAGWPYEEVKGASYNDSRYDIVNEDGDSIDAGDTTFGRVLSRETCVHGHVIGIRRPSGKRAWLSVSEAPQYGDSGELERAAFAFEDITEQREHDQELEAQNARLSEFAGIVSHDLRNPLGVVETSLELAQEERESDHLHRARDALERSQTLIDELLTLAREGNEVADVEPVELAEVAEGCWDSVETDQATLETERTPVIDADRSRLKQLLENLYRNAVEHGGEDVTVRVGAMENGFYVADTGPGIPESEREAVFEAGYSTDDEGTGFGLRIVEEVASVHGCDVAVIESKQGGTRFEMIGGGHAE